MARVPGASQGVAQSLSESDLDAYRSPILHSELAGLATVFDAGAMGEIVQAALIGTKSGEYGVESCELDQVTYLAGEDCEARYLLTVQERARGTMVHSLVVARVFPDSDACSTYVGQKLAPLAALLQDREEARGFETLAAAVHGNTALSTFPLDGELPTLVAATDPKRMLPLLDGLPGINLSIDNCRVELVDYARRHRCVLRYHLEGKAQGSGLLERTVVYGKVFPGDRGAEAGPVIAALQERATAKSSPINFGVPRSFGWLPDLKLLLLEAVPGKAVVPELLKARLREAGAETIPDNGIISLEGAIEGCARVAAALHTSDVKLVERRAFEDEVLQLRYELAHVRRLSPGLGALLDSRLGELELRAGELEPLDFCFSHGDYTLGQLLFDGANCGLVDFDSVCQAEPALDLGQFIAYLRISGAKTKGKAPSQPSVADDMAARFLHAYVAATDGRWEAGFPASAREEQLRSRVSIYTAISLLRRAVRSWEKFKPKRVASALALLEEEI